MKKLRLKKQVIANLDNPNKIVGGGTSDATCGNVHTCNYTVNTPCYHTCQLQGTV
jgi:hypothetical protein